MNLEELSKFNDQLYDASGPVSMVMNTAIAAALVVASNGDLVRCLTLTDKLSETCAITPADLRPLIDKLLTVIPNRGTGARLNTLFPLLKAFTIEELGILKDNERLFGNTYTVVRKLC